MYPETPVNHKWIAKWDYDSFKMEKVTFFVTGDEYVNSKVFFYGIK